MVSYLEQNFKTIFFIAIALFYYYFLFIPMPSLLEYLCYHLRNVFEITKFMIFRVKRTVLCDCRFNFLCVIIDSNSGKRVLLIQWGYVITVLVRSKVKHYVYIWMFLYFVFCMHVRLFWMVLNTDYPEKSFPSISVHSCPCLAWYAHAKILTTGNK